MVSVKRFGACFVVWSNAARQMPRFPPMKRLIDALADAFVTGQIAELPQRQSTGSSDMSLCLSRDEIAEFTRSKLKAGQIEFLVRNGIRHYVDAHGRPVVTRAAIGIPSDPAENAAPPRWRSNKAGK